MSIVGVWLVVSGSRHTVPVFAAGATIVAGEEISPDDLDVVDVALGDRVDAYAVPGAVDPGVVATRTIEVGELVPRSALGDAADVRTTTVVLASRSEVPATVVKGTVVEVWAAARLDTSTYDVPRVLVPRASVVSVTRDNAVVGSAEVALELVVARDEVPDVLAAVAAGDSLSMVPATGAAP